MKHRRTLYVVDYCLTPYENVNNGAILCEGESIIGVGGVSAFTRESDLDVVEMSGTYAVPGFIDTHIHGAGGFDSSAADEEGENIDSMCNILASHGVTQFLPTLVSGPIKKMKSSLRALVKFINTEHFGAEPVGIHLEGPFINREKRGSQILKDIIPIDLGLAKDLIETCEGKLKIMTFAPELDKADKLVELLLENDVTPSMGHSLADEASVMRVIDAGARRCTHLFNGMPPLHQRNVTLTAIALTDDRVTIEMIMDGAHLHPRMVDLACRAKPKDKLIGVSDAIQAAGLRDGLYHIGKSEINVKNGMSTTKGGVLAGTTLTLEKGWHHLVTYSHMDRTDAAACFSINPARNIGLDKVGELRPGRLANISFFDSINNKARLTVVRGKVVFDSRSSLTCSMKRPKK